MKTVKFKDLPETVEPTKVEPEFKAGDEVEVWDDEDFKSEKLYRFFADGKHWVSSSMDHEGVVTYKHIRKPEPDKHLREIASSLESKYVKGRTTWCDKEKSFDGRRRVDYHFFEGDLESMLIEALKKGKEL